MGMSREDIIGDNPPRRVSEQLAEAEELVANMEELAAKARKILAQAREAAQHA